MGGTFLRIAGAFGVSCLLACGGSDGDDALDPGSGSSGAGGGSSSSSGAPAQTVTLTGTAAVGAPIAAATITAKCADGSGFTGTVVSGSTGTWTGSVAQSALPCALQITSTSPALTLHGFATSAGVANLTPLTDLILALAAAQLPVDWYASAAWQNVATAIGAATETFQRALVAAGFTLPPGPFTPFTAPFVAGGSDPWDQLLEALAAALAADPNGYAALLAQLAAGNVGALPSAGPLTGNGITGVVAGTPHTFTDNVGFSALTHVIGAYGKNAAGQIDPLTRWMISGLPSAPGTYACKSDPGGILPKVELQLAGAYSGTPPTGGACSIVITRVAGDEIEGSFTATLVGEDGVTVTQVEGGAFRKLNDDDGGGQPLGSTDAGASFVVDGRTYRYDTATSLAYEEFAGVKLGSTAPTSPGVPLGIQIHTVPNASGTYACDSGGNSYRKLNVWFYWHGEMYTAGNRANPAAQPAGSSCSVTVGTTGTVSGGDYLGTFDGTFAGTFVSADGARSVTVTDGRFRLIGAPAPAIDPALAPLVGTRSPVVISGGNNFGTADGAAAPVVIDANGTVHVAGRDLSGYSVLNLNEDYLAEPNVRLTMPSVNGVQATTFTIFMAGANPVAYRLNERRVVDGSTIGYELNLAFRPIQQPMLDAMTSLYVLKDAVMTRVAGGACATMTVEGSATLTLQTPYLQLFFPAIVTDTWGDSSARLGSDGGVPTLTTYYNRYYFPAPGVVDLHPLGGNHQDYGVVWTNDPVRAAAACP